MEVASATRRGSAISLFATLAFAAAVLAVMIGLFVDQAGLVRSTAIPLSYFLIGVLVKYGDQAFDFGLYSKRTALLLALPTGLWLGSLVLLDEATAVIFVGMLLALLVAGKYDNIAFRIAFAAAMLMSLAALTMVNGIGLVGIAVVFILALLDEKVDALPADGDRSFMAGVMHQRPLLKVGVLVLCSTGALPSFMYLFAFLSFDFGYSMVDVASTSRYANGSI